MAGVPGRFSGSAPRYGALWARTRPFSGQAGLAEKINFFWGPLTPGDPWAKLGASFCDNRSACEPMGSHVAPIRPDYRCPVALLGLFWGLLGSSTSKFSKFWTFSKKPSATSGMGLSHLLVTIRML